MSQKRFGPAMTERGFPRTEIHGIWYLGIELRPECADGTSLLYINKIHGYIARQAQ
jgi:hypothetical protein